jgi:hypothetical protein
VGAAKVRLAPGQTVTARVAVDPGALRHRDLAAGTWVTEDGPLELRVARSAGDAGTIATVVVAG